MCTFWCKFLEQFHLSSDVSLDNFVTALNGYRIYCFSQSVTALTLKDTQREATPAKKIQMSTKIVKTEIFKIYI